MLRTFRHLRSADNERGFSLIAVLVAMAIGGVVVFNLSQSLVNTIKVTSLNRKTDSAKVSGNSGLNLATALLRFASNQPTPGEKPAVFPEPYIPSHQNEPIRLVKFTSVGPDSKWDIVNGNFVLTLPDSSFLKSEEVEKAYASHKLDLPISEQQALIKVIETRGRNYLIESLKVEASIQTQDGRKLSQKALIAIPKPPQPVCRISSSRSGTLATHVSSMNLTVIVDGISTQGVIKKNNRILNITNLPEQTRSITSLNAKIFDQTVDLDYGSNIFSASIQNVEGQTVSCGSLTVVRSTPPPLPLVVSTNDCSRVCPDSSGTPRRSHDWFKGPTHRILSDFRGTGYYPCLLVKAGETSVDGAIIGFDPKNNCASVGQIGSRSTGCFSSDTMIRVAPDMYHPIHQFVPGMQVWNPFYSRATRIKRIVKGYEKHPMLLVTIDGISVKVTHSHPFFDEAGLIKAAELRVGMKILDPSGIARPITHLEWYEPEAGTVVWNLELESESGGILEHALDANGFITGDLFLQEKISVQDRIQP